MLLNCNLPARLVYTILVYLLPYWTFCLYDRRHDDLDELKIALLCSLMIIDLYI